MKKKLLLASISFCFFVAASAQIIVQANPAAQKTDTDYFLSIVTATIKTGKDNKEYPSRVDISVYCGNMGESNNHVFFSINTQRS